MIDVAIAIDAEAVSVSLTKRAAGGFNADGDFVPGTATAASIKAAIFPYADGNQKAGNLIEDESEGIRTEAEWTMWTRSAVAVDDQVTYGGVDYRVIKVRPRIEGGFYRAILGRLA